MGKTRRLGEILLSQGLISEDQLDQALEEQKKLKEPLGEVLLKLQYIKRETDILVALSQQLNISILIGEQLKPQLDQNLHLLIPEALARQYSVLPLQKTEKQLTVAFAYTFDPSVVEELTKRTHLEIDPVLTKKKDLEPKLEEFYALCAKTRPEEEAPMTVDIKASVRKLKLGEILVQQGLITDNQLQEALEIQKKENRPLGEILVDLQFVRRETDIIVALSQQLNIPMMIGEQLNPRADQRLKEIFPESFARDKLALPLFRSGRNLTVAFAKPFDFLMLDDLRKLTGLEIIPVLAGPTELEKKIQMFYGSVQLEEVTSGRQMEEETKSAAQERVDVKIKLNDKESNANQPPVIRFVDLLLKKAIEDKASDIHIEPFEDRLIVRYRLDGNLYELPPPPKQLHLAVVSRIKILSRMDIAEKRIPQDGSFSIQYTDRNIDVRVSTVPVVHGERVVMRLLDKGSGIKTLNQLGFEEDQVKIFKEAVKRPHGLIFITGPTGSGKSTTLYAALNYIKAVDTNILTIEDPVEYQMEGVGQVQVRSDIGLTFASGLRAFLRQDPDVILVGEVRDEETAEVCVRASLTGHLVLSTLHTNDAPTAVTRLIDIGVKPYLVSSSLLMVGAQRLIRKLCPHCKSAYEASEKEAAEFKLKTRKIYRTKGCKKCRDIGYWGREAIYEIMPINENIRHLIARNEDLGTIRKAAREAGMQTLLESGIKKVEQGVSTFEEVLSIAYES
ncbi:MAG: type II secretion system protein GspE [Candidatus Omnitrophica bacterium CG11_big_fil_rev_8_21_14_0_20_45_26]|uniref:Type II secretion system protein GspE n=1 Tax=Candidatus Abzuiibacterium crystallinum TaxID=1974748 RepID=A0A2H0LM13_9BACT|nr:MAG: type II secretion system protein GspE [Candidatus Omnitrophica bacterium CG11_big_fil_rev_8_21_14_0_20_45_26]PIW63654.1 MAG: type II secretion system protein GspE [Candidatus Omnitrophica bacterium CG12_big_fil_rev_8_21_14_0_65_45_16]